jgi:hypothetical protein
MINPNTILEERRSKLAKEKKNFSLTFKAYKQWNITAHKQCKQGRNRQMSLVYE